MKHNRKPYRRRHNLSRIKQDVSYEYHEVAKLLGVCRGTVRQWAKQGLPVMRSKRPHLIKGAELKAFLKARNARGKHKCQSDELYCLGCKLPRCAWENVIDVKAINEKTVLLQGICEVCGGKTSKLQSMKAVPDIAKTLRVQQWHNGHLIARMHPHLNYHLEKESET